MATLVYLKTQIFAGYLYIIFVNIICIIFVNNICITFVCKTQIFVSHTQFVLSLFYVLCLYIIMYDKISIPG